MPSSHVQDPVPILVTGHIEERNRDEKSNGLSHLPLGTMRANYGWLVATVLATNLMAMLSATVRDVEEPAALPPDCDSRRDPAYRTSPVPGRLVHRSRQLHLRLPQGWWWAETCRATYRRLRSVAVT